MNQWVVLQWRPSHCPNCLFSRPPSLPIVGTKLSPHSRVFATLDSATSTVTGGDTEQQLSARERRQLRNERRELNATHNWREEVEERLMIKPKKKYVSKLVELNLDNLALLGQQWWIVRVARTRSDETADLIARLLVKNFPEMEFKVYAPAIQEKRKLKNGTFSVKPKPLFPGCVFLRCILNREIHDFLRDVIGVGGFVGSKVGNNKRMGNKPKPVSEVDMEAIFREAKEEKERYERAFLEEHGEQESLEPDKIDTKSIKKTLANTRQLTKTSSNSLSSKKDDDCLVVGSAVRIVSGNFAEFIGILKKLSKKTKKATVILTIFGKESLVDLDVSEIAAAETP